MFTGSVSRGIVTGLLLGGTGLFLYFYHVRTRRFDPSDRPQVTSWGFYVWIDWYLKISTLGIALLSLYRDPSWLLRVHNHPALGILGLAMAGLALWLFSGAMRSLDAQFTPAHESHVPEKLVRTGPYRFIRHPIYTSNLMLLGGLFLLSGSLLILLNVLILIAYYVPIIMLEERALREHLPEYNAYKKKTGRFFPKLR